MKLQQRLNRKVGDKEYVKWYIDIPSNIIDEAGWKEGSELDVVVKDGKVMLRSKK
jgi:AbrB family looped-hinge helix DNA binding protein